MHPSNFDELTKALASSTSRRHALKTILTAAIGGMFGLGGIRSAFGRNRDCAQWCAQVFGPNTPAAMQCTSDGAHHKGLCITCPNSVTPSSVCCVRNTSGYCSSYTGAHCCASGQTCQNSQCVTPCTQAGQACTVNTCCSGLCCNGICCDSGQTCLNNQTCCAQANVCGSTCLSVPCATNQCLTCDSTSSACVSTCSAAQTCNNGICCIANAGSCTSDSQCCSNNCDSTTGKCVSCIPSGDSGCASNTDCCSGLVCDTTTSTCVACIKSNDLGCASNSDCCSGICSSGTCVCSATGSSCAADKNCCSGACCNGSCCDSGYTCVNNACCPNARACGSTCLAAPCDASQCQYCDSSLGTCVSCSSGQVCVSGTCCTPNCTGKTCGDDGCGGSCGSCSTGQTCTNGTCCGANGSACTSDSQCCSKICNPITMTCASCLPSGGGCAADLECCSGNCSKTAPTDIDGHCCDSGYTYVGGTCCANANVCGSVCCASGQKCCSGTCHQCCTNSDCPSGTTCSNGQCVGSGGGGGCFVAGTPVVMAGGYHQSIDSIQVGDTILAWNEDTRQIFPTPVVEALHHEETMQTLFDIELENRGKFTVNDNHRMYVAEDEGFIVSRELAGRFGNGKPITFLGNNKQPVKLVSLRMRSQRCKVYNLHVKGQGEKGHTYFANGILVHNVKI